MAQEDSSKLTRSTSVPQTDTLRYVAASEEEEEEDDLQDEQPDDHFDASAQVGRSGGHGLLSYSPISPTSATVSRKT